ncbi:MAG: hypothetical protein ABSH21_06855 [Verrucomicrobiia bacterium]|jgi:hypothetical protein
MPRIQTTPMVKVALYSLRIYLIILLTLILIKFIRIFCAKPADKSGAKQEEQQKPN